MPFEPIHLSAQGIDLSARILDTTTVQNSPIAAAAETIIATLNVPNFGNTTIVSKVYLDGWAAYTIGGAATATTLRIRQTDGSGTVVATTGALTAGVAAAALAAQDVSGSDATPGVAKYVLTLQVTSGNTNTTISAVSLRAYIV